MPPQISVVMSVYNGKCYFREAVDSILQQTFGDFEFIIVDDCSTDGVGAILDSYSDSRIVRLLNEENKGLTHSLNRGLEIANGKYIARMDADDVSLPERFEKQHRFMERNLEVGVLGTNMMLIDAYAHCTKRAMYRRAPDPEYINWALLWQNPLPHPTVMLRRAILDQLDVNYDPQCLAGQDYELWARLRRYTKLAILEDVCLRYRVIETSVTRRQAHLQRKTQQFVMQREFRILLGDRISETGIETLVTLITGQSSSTNDPIGAADILLSVYRYYRGVSKSQAAQRQIQHNTVNYLYQLWQKHKDPYPLRCMREVSWLSFLYYSAVSMV